MKKVRTTEAIRTKTQIPVVAKQTVYRMGMSPYYYRSKEFAFYQILYDNSVHKKGIKIPIDCILSLFGMVIIAWLVQKSKSFL